jgi:flagellar M-ring protein FliF
MATLRTLFTSIGPVRLAVLALVTAASLGFIGWVATRVSEPTLALLYGDLDMGDSAQVVTYLESAGIPYRLEGGGTTVLVPANAVARSRVALAEQGVPAGGSLGYEIFDKNSALGTTQFIQNVNLVRALEGELSRTIRAISGVKNARVHLVLPKRELFSRQRQQPSASVLLDLRGGAGLGAPQVVAIQNLVASAVPGLTPDRISIVDSRGTLLSDGSSASDAGLTQAKDEERRLRFENRLSRAVEALLESVVGTGKVRAEVAAEMDFDRINTSEERYDPDGQVVRSTRSVEESGSNREPHGGPVTVADSLPDALLAGEEAGAAATSQENRTEEVVNYEISRKTINHVRETGVVKKLSVAVLVDGLYPEDDAGASSYQPRSAEELAQLTALVRGAIGYDADRGDTLEVINMQFAEIEPLSEAPDGVLLGLEKAELFRIGQLAALSVIAILVLLLVIRPVVSRTLDALSAGGGAGSGAGGGAGGRDARLQGRGAQPALEGPAAQRVEHHGQPRLEHADGGIDLDQVEGRVNASSLKSVTEIVEKHPEESLSIVRSWLHADN